MPGWAPLSELLRQELIQRREEGCDIGDLERRVDEAIHSGSEKRIHDIYDQLTALPISPDFPFMEPSDIEGIRGLRPPRQLLKNVFDSNDLSDKFTGAWLGRCVGCALGKPLEAGPFMGGSSGNPGWKNVYLWFKEAGAWPIKGYTPGTSPAGKRLGIKCLPCEKSHRENVHFMESDDDIRYTVLGLTLLEQKGSHFDTWDVAEHWHNNLTYGQVCTAETQAYLNFAQVTSHVEKRNGSRPIDWQRKLDWVRTYRNPYREWIGAQIRADGLAYGAAGQPELSAELAWRDASLSHVKNGVYGEMFIAAMIAAAFVENDAEKIIQVGLGQIPTTSRLAKDIKKAVDLVHKAKSQLKLVELIWNTFGHYHPVHTNNNAALVTAAILFAQDDFETAITTAVLGGWDTDCNGATVGSIMGAKLGARALPKSWTASLNDTLYAEVNGFNPIAISECARRSETVFWKLRNRPMRDS